MEIYFSDINKNDEVSLDSIEGHNGLKYSMAVAAAGRHHLLAIGVPGCGKSLTLQHMPELMPQLTTEESHSTTRIHSIAGLLNPNDSLMKTRPFRMPHQTASIEGICGGGPNCKPGEISLAHNGILFLDEAAEFRSAVLQMLRVPLENHTITLCRAGRSTVYPANFQLVMTANPCPCGNYGSKDRICLCSMKSVEQYWKKFSGPLLDRIAIRFDCNDDDGFPEYTLNELREFIKRARLRQFKRQGKLNEELKGDEVLSYIKLSDEASEYLLKTSDKQELFARTAVEVTKVAQTLADMFEDTEDTKVTRHYVAMALRLRGVFNDTLTMFK